MSDIDTKRKDFHDALCQRYWELEAARAVIAAKSAPLRAKRDAEIDTLTPPQDRALIASIKEAERGLYDIDRERGEIVKTVRDPLTGKAKLGLMQSRNG